MKKFLRAIFSLMIVSAAICTVFSFNPTKAAAVEDNIKYDNNYKSPNSSGSASATVFLYKVSVYVDTDGTANKTSPISEFEIKKTRYIGEDFVNGEGKTDFGRGLVPYGGTKSKFEYLSNTSSLPIEEIKKKDVIYWNLGNAKVNLNLNSKDEGKKVKAFFGGSDGSNCYQFVQAIDRNISKDDSWVLIVEPVIRTYTGNVLRYYTPTEYAVAINSGGYDSFNTGPNSSCALLTLAKPGDLGYLDDGTWLHAGDDSSVESSWSNFDYSGKKNAWLKQSDYYIKYAGVFVWFSGAFEYSDYTLADGGSTNTEKFENEEITLSTVINRTNPGKAGTVNVTLDLQDYSIEGAAISGNATQSVSFATGEKSKTVSWKVNVGSYGAYSTSRSYNYTINVAATGTTKELNTDNNTLTGTITLKRDFQVTNVSLDKKECFENGVARVSFSVKNANPYKEYDGLPITVYFTYGGNTVRIGETTVKLGKGETKNGSCSINVGSVTDNCDQTDTVTVVINSWNVSAENGSKYSEPNMSNNKNAANIRVKRDINLSVSIVYKDSWKNPIGNAPSKVKNTEKTQAITTCSVANHSRFNLYESDPMNDKVTVTFYVNNQKIGSQTVPVPRYGSNLVWFKWDVPESSSVTLRAEVSWNVNQESVASPYADNTASKSLQIDKVFEYDTPDMGQKDQNESGANANFSDAFAYERLNPYIAKWSQWICDNKGTFTRIDYALTGDSALELTLDELTYDEKTMASGAGVSAIFSYDVRTECSEPGYDVAEKDFTYAQDVVATFPEFNYVIKGDCRTMYLSKEDGNLKNPEFRFEQNVTQDPTRKRRVHFTPKSMPDGEYKVGVVASQLWTPAGPIYVNANSSVRILDSGDNMYYVS